MLSAKNIFKITYPVFLTLLVQNIINVTDTAFLGRVSEVALGASAIGGVYFLAIFMIGFGFSQGTQIIIGRRNGEKAYASIGPIFNNGMIFILFLSLCFLVFSIEFNEKLMKYLVSSDHVYHASLEYLHWRKWSFVFAFINVMFRGLLVGITRTSALTVSAILTAVVNIVLDYAMVFGNWGFPEMGIAGAALASVIAEAVSSVYLFLYTFFNSSFKKYRLYKLKQVNFRIVGQILEISVFIMFQYFISISTWFIFFIFIERMGERALAATNIGRSLYVMLMIPGSALATTVSTIVSNLIGADRKAEVVPFINRILGVALLLVAPVLLFTFFFPEIFARIYTDVPELIQASVPVMKVVSIAMLFCAVGSILFQAVSGTGNTRTAFALEVGTLFFYLSYIYYVAIINPQPIAIVWMSEFVYWSILGIGAFFYLKFGKWQLKVI
ncbi:MATE family efflux transporter [Paludibacter sp.]